MRDLHALRLVTDVYFQNIVAAAGIFDKFGSVHAGKAGMNFLFVFVNVIHDKQIFSVARGGEAVMTGSHLHVVLFENRITLVLDEIAERGIANGVAYGVILTAEVVCRISKIIFAFML